MNCPNCNSELTYCFCESCGDTFNTKEMKEIQQVYDYLKNKLLNGDFKVLITDEMNMIVEVDNKYQFNFWIANLTSGHEYIYLWDWFKNFIHIEFTDDEKRILQKVLKPLVDKFQKASILAKKQQQIELIQKEIECLNQQ